MVSHARPDKTVEWMNEIICVNRVLQRIKKKGTDSEMFAFLYCCASNWIFIYAEFLWSTCKTAIGDLKWGYKWISRESRKYIISSLGTSDGYPPLKWLFELGEIRNINNSDTCPHPHQQCDGFESSSVTFSHNTHCAPSSPHRRRRKSLARQRVIEPLLQFLKWPWRPC